MDKTQKKKYFIQNVFSWFHIHKNVRLWCVGLNGILLTK